MVAESGTLTVVAVKAADVGKHGDGGGLFLQVMPTGARYWRMKYRHGGKEKLLSFGVFPEVSLAEARRRRDAARKHLRDGTDQMVAKVDRAATDRRHADAAFPKVAAAWLAHRRPSWAPETYRKALFVVDTYLMPPLRRHSITTLPTKDAARVIEAIAKNAPSLATKARQYLGGIVGFAIRRGLRDDGRLLALRGTVPKHDQGNIPAATDLADVRAVVRAVDGYAVPVTRAALSIAMLTAQRPGVVVAMEWAELDLDAGEWSIPGGKMKMRHPHIVPLPRQAVALLRGMLAYTDGRQFVFPPLARQKTAHLHRDALSAALRRMGFQGRHATHGFRAMFRTAARERLGIDQDVLEAQLAHAKKGEVQRAYDRATFGDARRKAMQRWADFLDGIRSDGTITPLRRRGAA